MPSALLVLVAVLCMVGWLLLLAITGFDGTVTGVGLLAVLWLSGSPPKRRT
ncbi:MAG: hypothetical protein JOZ41_02210 [Chloroflexi bacterium]|nr:hypothetical protein [Chloroflexota bacterium]